jgi:hypothetical protein
MSSEHSIQLQSLVTQLISDYNQVNQLSKDATIKVATALIQEYQATVDQINSLKVQIESVRN